jgi:hypothetical protein
VVHGETGVLIIRNKKSKFRYILTINYLQIPKEGGKKRIQLAKEQYGRESKWKKDQGGYPLCHSFNLHCNPFHHLLFPFWGLTLVSVFIASYFIILKPKNKKNRRK